MVGCTWMLSNAGVLSKKSAQDKHSALRWLPAMLSLPHAAFAIGLVALLTPGGWLLRLLSPWATGLQSPPSWTTTQDPWGLGLIAVLALKELPYLLWVALAYLQQTDVGTRLRKEHALACTLGYSHQEAWWRVVWPQLMQKMGLPYLAVLAYGLGNVDVALIIGPNTPPTLSVLAWQWLQDADTAVNAQGAAAAWLLLALTALCALVHWSIAGGAFWRVRRTQGFTPHKHSKSIALPFELLAGTYTAVLCALVLGSVVGVWPFPALLPQSWTGAAWQSVWESREVLWTTSWLALASTAVALIWSVLWLECVPAAWTTSRQARSRWQRKAVALVYLPLVLPPVLWVLGLHQLTITGGLDTTAVGLWLAHTLACVPYVLLGIAAPYRGFDPRLQFVAASLGRTRFEFLLRVKWPLLKATLASGFAVGFAVSVAQYLPTLYVGAGRFATVTTETVSLAAGGQRAVASAFAWLQWMLPVLIFSLAALFFPHDRKPTA